MKCVILQPSYIPWRGYFDQIYKADVFVFYDDVQYDKNGWRNRNRIKTPQSSLWLTIPVSTKGVVENHTPINEVRIDWRKDWARKHWATLKQSYGKSPHFDFCSSKLEEHYNMRPELLSDFTVNLTMDLSRLLGIHNTRFLRSSELSVSGSKTGRLLDILEEVGATHYISGPSARGYLDEERLTEAGISIEYMAYNYPTYEQLYPPFDGQVSILDLLFMTGKRAPEFIWKVPSMTSQEQGRSGLNT